MTDDDVRYRALCARDPRFDGVFFVGVVTTGIYCRPICPARQPARRSCRFFGVAAAAEAAGFRPCLRCRPELAPGHASVDAPARTARIAAAKIAAGALNGRSVDALARDLGVTGRHLRRAVQQTFGVSPHALATTQRLALARRLLRDSALTVTQVALASGFTSLRRLDAAHRAKFGSSPGELRRGGGGAAAAAAIPLRLDYRPPFDFDALLTFLAARAIPGVERVDAHSYERTLALGPCRGTVRVTPIPGRAALVAHVSPSLQPVLASVVARLRALFDLDARPHAIADVLAADPRLAASVNARPGLRVPGAVDGFELAVRAVLGQQVSVRGAVTLAARLVERFGTTLDATQRVFPTPHSLSAAGADALRGIGLTHARAACLHALADAVANGGLDLDDGADPVPATAALARLPGVGPWTVAYVAMRALRDPDAFPAGDLVLRRALGVRDAAAAERRAERFGPWRAYAAVHLWTESATGITP